jgi:hypothetical protein
MPRRLELADWPFANKSWKENELLSETRRCVGFAKKHPEVAISCLTSQQEQSPVSAVGVGVVGGDELGRLDGFALIAMRPREHDDELPHYRTCFSFSCSLYLSGDVALEVAEVGA